MFAGIAVNCLGHGHPALVKAIQDQAEKLIHVSSIYYNEPALVYAKRLVDKTGFDRIFYANSGAEANEGAIKLAVKYTGKSEVISTVDSFHGRTIMTLAATGHEEYHEPFKGILPEGFINVPYNDLEAIKEAVTENTAAIIVEPVQGEGGVHALDKEFVKAAADLCREKDILFIDDEVQAGIGRTGTLFAFEQYGIQPDIVSFAKGIGAGLPIGGIICGPKTCDVLVPGDHGSTFGMNPVACAGACVVLDTLDRSFLELVNIKAAFIRQELAGMKKVTGLDGLGLMIGIDLDGMTGAEAVKLLMDEGVMAIPAGKRLRLLPPLTISAEEIAKALVAMKKVLD
jgi:acetylornithine/N-succinyldiaminopimelate aminotransferase